MTWMIWDMTWYPHWHPFETEKKNNATIISDYLDCLGWSFHWSLVTNGWSYIRKNAIDKTQSLVGHLVFSSTDSILRPTVGEKCSSIADHTDMTTMQNTRCFVLGRVYVYSHAIGFNRFLLANQFQFVHLLFWHQCSLVKSGSYTII